MVISGVIKRLIINFSPSFAWLPGVVRSVCVSFVSSAGNIHYTCCVTQLIFVKLRSWVGLKWTTTALKHSAVYSALLGTEDHCPWFWAVVSCGFWKDSSGHPQHPQMGHWRRSLYLWKKEFPVHLKTVNKKRTVSLRVRFVFSWSRWMNSFVSFWDLLSCFIFFIVHQTFSKGNKL